MSHHTSPKHGKLSSFENPSELWLDQLANRGLTHSASARDEKEHRSTCAIRLQPGDANSTNRTKSPKQRKSRKTKFFPSVNPACVETGAGRHRGTIRRQQAQTLPAQGRA